MWVLESSLKMDLLSHHGVYVFQGHPLPNMELNQRAYTIRSDSRHELFHRDITYSGAWDPHNYTDSHHTREWDEADRQDRQQGQEQRTHMYHYYH